MLIVSALLYQPEEDENMMMVVEEEPEIGAMINLFLINF
jgi:hypothetical protein